MEKTYIAKGEVLGHAWGGGQFSYPSVQVSAGTLDELYDIINKSLQDGSLDSGYGFESLKGCLMKINCICTIIHEDGLSYSRQDDWLEVFGDLNEQEQEFLAQYMLKVAFQP